tara:strand:- start:4831 stop:5139 length:309 start_codon:yes stop_codon:yes gene_type:complete
VGRLGGDPLKIIFREHFLKIWEGQLSWYDRKPLEWEGSFEAILDEMMELLEDRIPGIDIKRVKEDILAENTRYPDSCAGINLLKDFMDDSTKWYVYTYEVIK